MTAWTARTEPVNTGQRVRLEVGGKPVSFGRWLDALAGDPGFAVRYSAILGGAPWPAFFWEHPPLTRARLDAPLEFVLLDAPGLAGFRGDPTPFAGPFAADGSRAVRFSNLGGDAELIAPRPDPDEPAYPHLAAFARLAPPASQETLWRTVAEAVRARLGARPVWLSTSGLGVPWLHVRLDAVPKYYQFAPYRSADSPEAVPGNR